MRSVPLPDELYAPRMSWRPDADLPVVERFGDYEILGCVGKGGMAEILLARESGAQGQARPVVIKRVLPEIANDLGVVTMFRDEARLVMALDHPNICRIYEVGQVGGRWFIAMEWIHGASLSDMIDAALHVDPKTGATRAQFLPASAVAHLITVVARALDYAHRATDKRGESLRLVHRDVSPQNIMVGFDGTVRLLDFGLAKATTQTYKTESGVVKGKLAYLAPEQWQGGTLDGRADLFALGLCLYEALTGHVLYQRERAIDTMTAVANDPAPDPRALRPQLDPRFTGLLKTALQKKAADRFQTGDAFAKALSPLADAAEPQGQLRALMHTLFPEEAMLGPQLGWLSKLPRPSSIAEVPATPKHVDSKSMMRISQAAKAMRGGHRSLWLALATLGLAVAGVLYAMGWRLK
jgi:serine/threonine protein kinase